MREEAEIMDELNGLDGYSPPPRRSLTRPSALRIKHVF
jgi:hypothetical protein